MRARPANDRDENPRGELVLYWMTSARRASHSHALDEAVAASRRLGKPLLVLEALRVGYPWASDRHHAFVLAGMADNAAAFAKAGVTYYPYVERAAGQGHGLLEALAKKACLVVADDFPSFFLPRMLAAAAKRLPVKVVAVDGNGLLPMREPGQAFPTAIAFRRYLHRHLAPHLGQLPSARPFAGKKLPEAEIPGAILRRWPAGIPEDLAALPIDHAVPPSPIAGGTKAGRAHLADFLARLDRYGEDRNDPDKDAGSGFSPYLHHGQLSTAEIFAALAEQEGWNPGKLGGGTIGHKAGYWNMSPSAEGFLDELVTWRELGYGFAAHREDHAEWSSLPEWAQKDLLAHAADPREHVYSLEDFAASRTHDELWNAAQNQLREEGRIHNYLRMLWGKKILEWTRHPQDALRVLIELNNRYAVDGRDPNSYTGIFWVLGRHDRPWAPRRPIFGVIRYMSSDATRRKLEVKQYLQRWSRQT